MPGLEQAFYIVGLIFMGLMLLILIGVLAAVLVIRKKIVSLHDTVLSKFETAFSFASQGAAIARTVEKTVGKAIKHRGH